MNSFNYDNGLIRFPLLLALIMTAILVSSFATRQCHGAEAASDFLISNYDIDVEITPADKFVSARAVITVEPTAADAGSLRLYLHEEFTVHSVSENGRPLTFIFDKSQSDDRPMYSPTARPLEIRLGADPKSESRKITITYSGPVSRTVGMVNLISEKWTEIALYCAWFPMEKENGRFTYELHLTLPSGQASVTDGELVRESEEDGKVTRLYRRREAGFDIPVMASGDFKVREKQTPGIKASVYYQVLDDAEAEEILDSAGRSAAWMAQTLGDPIVPGRLIIVCSPRERGGGYARVPLIVGMESYFRRILDTKNGRIGNLHGTSHEIAHFWWNIAGSTTSDDWINEGLAEYFALRSVERDFGARSADRLWKASAWQIQGLTNAKPIVESLRNERNSYVLYYNKGSYIFRMLESMLGEQKLMSVLKSFYQAHRNRRDATTSELISVFTRSAGAGLAPFFDQFLRQSTLPAIKLEWRWEEGAVTGKAILEDTAIEGFPLGLAFMQTGWKKIESRTIRVSAGDNAFRFPLEFQPDRVVADPEGRFLDFDPDAGYARRLVPLLHGPDMDFKPETIPADNVEKAGALLAEWTGKAPAGLVQNCEWGWYLFLKAQYPEAIERFKAALPYADSTLSPNYSASIIYRNLGLCYDRSGDHEKARECYEKGEAQFEETGLPETARRALFHAGTQESKP